MSAASSSKMSFWGELRRRNVFKVGAAYVIVAWLVLQVASIAVPAFEAPDWLMPILIVLMVLGLPVALVLAWAYEITPEGLKPSAEVERADSITRKTGQKLNYVIIGMLATALVLVVVDQYVLEDRAPAELEGTAVPVVDSVDGSSERAVQRVVSSLLPNSVAVLPFDNLSPNSDDAYFAEGMHEEVLNQLNKLSRLTVIGGTTMRQYRNTDKSIGQIGNELKVKTVMEGAVRYADRRVRVTIQLSDAETGAQLWSETYEREFADIFSIESDIAMNVANSLQAEFSLAEQASIEQVPTVSPQAYALYLAANSRIAGGDFTDLQSVLRQIDRAVEIDPAFSTGWAARSSYYTYSSLFFPSRRDEYLQIAEQSARRSLEIDPAQPWGYVGLAMVAADRGDWPLARTEFDKVPNMRERFRNGLEPLATFQYIVGNTEAAYGNIRILRQSDPLNTNVAFWELVALDARGDLDGVLEAYSAGKTLYGRWDTGSMTTFMALLGSGEGEQALELARETLAPGIAAVLGKLDSPARALEDLHARYAGDDAGMPVGPQMLAALAAYFGDDALALDVLTDTLRAGPVGTHLVWRPIFRGVRRLAGFQALVRELGLLDYWREYGWPDLCSPTGPDTFECR